MADRNNLSAQSFVAPYRLIGDEALSVDSAITFFTSSSIAASIIFCDPITFVFTNSIGLYSAAGTCLRAAAWIIKSTSSNAIFNLCLSRMSPKKNLTSG